VGVPLRSEADSQGDLNLSAGEYVVDSEWPERTGRAGREWGSVRGEERGSGRSYDAADVRVVRQIGSFYNAANGALHERAVVGNGIWCCARFMELFFVELSRKVEIAAPHRWRTDCG
jgi:hypothetical protein